MVPVEVEQAVLVLLIAFLAQVLLMLVVAVVVHIFLEVQAMPQLLVDLVEVVLVPQELHHQVELQLSLEL